MGKKLAREGGLDRAGEEVPIDEFLQPRRECLQVVADLPKVVEDLEPGGYRQVPANAHLADEWATGDRGDLGVQESAIQGEVVVYRVPRDAALEIVPKVLYTSTYGSLQPRDEVFGTNIARLRT
jgi:hypothetical protein